ncbi:hypothetical protein C8R43DRAFT_503852 [Mycena crocata]|nr:hypothetical protein C8R43DRAFT_503852 [Mycena crocata]
MSAAAAVHTRVCPNQSTNSTARSTARASHRPNTSLSLSTNASSSKTVAKHVASCTRPQSASAAHVPTPVEAVIPVMTVGVSGLITAPRDVSKTFSAFSSSPSTAPATDAQDLTPAKVPTKVRRKLARLTRRTHLFSIDRIWAVYARTGSVERTRVMVGEMVAASCVVLRDAGIDIYWEKQSRKRKRKNDDGNDGTPKQRRNRGAKYQSR